MATSLENIKDSSSTLPEDIDRFCRFMTTLMSKTGNGFRVTLVHPDRDGKVVSTAKQATVFVQIPGDTTNKWTLRQNPKSDLGDGSAYIPVELASFPVEAHDANPFDESGVVLGTITGLGRLYDSVGKPVTNPEGLNIVRGISQDLLQRLGLYTPEQVFPESVVGAHAA